jgi:hypothetical protein
VRRWSAGYGVNAEAEESPLLEVVAKKRLVKTLRTRKDLVFAVVICKVWILTIVL